jgi:hypothetical protein
MQGALLLDLVVTQDAACQGDDTLPTREEAMPALRSREQHEHNLTRAPVDGRD